MISDGLTSRKAGFARFGVCGDGSPGAPHLIWARRRGGDPVTRLATAAIARHPDVAVVAALRMKALTRDSVGLGTAERERNVAGRVLLQETLLDYIAFYDKPVTKFERLLEIESEKAPKGLSEDIVRFIAAKKNEPDWLTEWRLEAYRRWLTMREPKWAKVALWGRIACVRLRSAALPCASMLAGLTHLRGTNATNRPTVRA